MTKKNKKSVLIVDDQPNWRLLLAELLEDEYEVVTAENPKNALAALWVQEPKFHVAIIDIRLKDKDPENESGLELIAVLNKWGKYTNAIVITGYPTMSTAKKALRDLAAFEYLLKYPEDGNAFDHLAFKSIVHQAAVAAEVRRQSVTTDDNKKEMESISEHPLDRNDLRKKLIDYFNEEDLRDVCFELAVPYDALSGTGINGKARELVVHLEKMERLPELRRLCRSLRPHVAW